MSMLPKAARPFATKILTDIKNGELKFMWKLPFLKNFGKIKRNICYVILFHVCAFLVDQQKRKID